MKQTKKLTQGAMMVAIVGLALFLNRQMAGILEFAIYWFLSFPIIIYTVKYGVKDALVPAVSMMVLSVIISAPTTIFYLGSSLFIGIIYGSGIRKKWSNLSLIIATFVVTFLSYIIVTFIFASIFGYSVSEEIEMIQSIVSMLQIDANINIAQLAIILSILSTVVLALLQSMCIHMVSVLLLKRLQIAIIPMKSVFDLKYPKWIAYLSICVISLFLLNSYINLGENVTIVLSVLFVIVLCIGVSDGILVIQCFLLTKKKQAYFWIVLLACIIPFVLIMVMMLGLYDIMKDVRGELKRGELYG